MKNISKNKIRIFLVALAGIGLSAAAQADHEAPLVSDALLVFKSEHFGVCAGYDPDGRNALRSLPCAELKGDRSALLSFERDNTIRNKQTGECLTHFSPRGIDTEPYFMECGAVQETQRFGFVSRKLGDGTKWRMLVPLSGPAGTFQPMPGVCLATGYPELVDGTASGVFVQSCEEGEYSPNKHVNFREF